MEKGKFRFKPYLIAGVISLVVGAAIFCLYFFLNRDKIGYDVTAASNGALIAGACIFAMGFFLFAGNQGFFDFVSYGFKQLGSQLYAKQANKFNNYPEYVEHKKEVRKSSSKWHFAVMIVGTAFILVALILFIIYKLSISK